MPSHTPALVHYFIKIRDMLQGVQASGHTVIGEIIPGKLKGGLLSVFLHCSLRRLFEGDIFLIVKMLIFSFF